MIEAQLDRFIDTLHDAFEAMRPGDFYPEGARARGEVYVERHSIAGGSWAFTVWRSDTPLEVNLDHTYQAIDAYLECIGVVTQ